MDRPKNILICPLDWGLGHATRCVPIIQKLIDAGQNVIIGSDNRPLAFLKQEFPALQFIQFPGYNITYPENGSMVLKMLIASPRLLRAIGQERRLLQKIISEYNIDIVISDNRYGLSNKKVKSVFITHQLSIKCPKWLTFLEYALFKINIHYINKFDQCWIPDFKGTSKFSGSLTEKSAMFKNAYFIGLLSRFNKPEYLCQENEIVYDVLFILSGPEPQRTIFENIILKQLKSRDQLKTLIVRGITESLDTTNISDNIQMVTHLETSQLAKAILQAKLVICRPGYSGIMDLLTLGKNAFFVPTPGQTEQEYLAKYFYSRHMFYFTKQHNFNIGKAIHKSIFSKGVKIKNDMALLDERLHTLLS